MDQLLDEEMKKTLFVTVGTTRFDALIDHVLSEEFLQLIKKFCYTHLIVQYGNGNILKKKEWVELGDECYLNKTVHITCFRLKPSLQETIQSADFVISHSGAGTALELLSNQKRCLLVINEGLMENHQKELGCKLEELHCALTATPTSLLCKFAIAQSWDYRHFKGAPDLNLFNKELQDLTGISLF